MDQDANDVLFFDVVGVDATALETLRHFALSLLFWGISKYGGNNNSNALKGQAIFGS